MQREVMSRESWLKDNRLYVPADKSKLIVVGTPELRKVVSWEEHHHKDAENTGLISQLNQRVVLST